MIKNLLEFHTADKEIYYLIGKEFWNQGYAYEAAAALVDHCFFEWNLGRLVAKVDARNIASKKIIEKLGFHFDHVISGLQEPFSESNDELYYVRNKDIITHLRSGGDERWFLYNDLIRK